MSQPNFFILSGGPGAGKTTTLEALRARGVACVGEAARKVLTEQARIGGDATHDGDRARYRDLMLAQGIADYRAAGAAAGPVFFDRGIPELSGYGNAPGAGDPPALLAAIAECRYGDTAFLFPPWREIYVHDDLRKHSFDHAERVFVDCWEAYRRFGYRPVEVPCAPVAERVAFILARVVPTR